MDSQKIIPNAIASLIFRTIFISGVPDRQIDTNEYVFVRLRERELETERERMGGGESLAYTAISDHLELP